MHANLVPPLLPTLPAVSSKQLQVWPWAAPLDDVVKVARFEGMVLFAGRDEVYLSPTRLEGADFLAPHTEQEQFRHVAEVKANAAPVWPAVLTNFEPHQISFVSEAPRL